MNPNKPKLALFPLWVMREVAQVYQKGLVGDRKPNGWQDLEWTKELKLEYDSALLRHLEEADSTTDPIHYRESLAAAMANLIILMYHEPTRIAAEHGWPDDVMVCGCAIDKDDVNVSEWKKENKAILTKEPGQHTAELIVNTPIDPIGQQNAITPDPDSTWHRLSGWIRLTGEDALAHLYDGPNAPLCDEAPHIPKGSARTLYNGPPDHACEKCAVLWIKRTEI